MGFNINLIKYHVRDCFNKTVNCKEFFVFFANCRSILQNKQKVVLWGCSFKWAKRPKVPNPSRTHTRVAAISRWSHLFELWAIWKPHRSGPGTIFFFFFFLCKQEQSTAMLGYGFHSALFELLNVVSIQFCHLDTRKYGWNCFGMLLSYYREFRGYKYR